MYADCRKQAVCWSTLSHGGSRTTSKRSSAEGPRAWLCRSGASTAAAALLLSRMRLLAHSRTAHASAIARFTSRPPLTGATCSPHWTFAIARPRRVGRPSISCGAWHFRRHRRRPRAHFRRCCSSVTLEAGLRGRACLSVKFRARSPNTHAWALGARPQMEAVSPLSAHSIRYP